MITSILQTNTVVRIDLYKGQGLFTIVWETFKKNARG